MRYRATEIVPIAGRFKAGRDYAKSTLTLQTTAPNTFARTDGGDFVADGWQDGMRFRVEGSSVNDLDFTINGAPSASSITTLETVTNEGPTPGVRMGGEIVARVLDKLTDTQVATSDMAAQESAVEAGLYLWDTSKITSYPSAYSHLYFALHDLVTGHIEDDKWVTGGHPDDMLAKLERLFTGNLDMTVYHAVGTTGAPRNVPDGAMSHIRTRIKAEAASDWSAPLRTDYLVYTYASGAGLNDAPIGSLVQGSAPSGTYTTPPDPQAG
jgi:hypothetical protein